MDYDPLMTDDRRELYTDEETGRQNSSKVEHDSNLVAGEGSVIVALSWRGRVSTLRIRRTEVATEIKVHKPSEREAKECTGEDEPEDEVVGFVEAKGVVDSLEEGFGAICLGGHD